MVFQMKQNICSKNAVVATLPFQCNLTMMEIDDLEGNRMEATKVMSLLLCKVMCLLFCFRVATMILISLVGARTLRKVRNAWITSIIYLKIYSYTNIFNSNIFF
jgi:hypothetical protein